MNRKFQKGEFVRFTQYDKFGNNDQFGYVHDYYGHTTGLRHYAIKVYTDRNKKWTSMCLRPANRIKKVSKEEEILYILENS